MERIVRVQGKVLRQMLEHARRTPVEECCGLLAGKEGVITRALPATNALHSPTAFEIAPNELFGLFRSMRVAGLEHFGIYHSHPTGDNVPSARDIERAYYPDAVYFILSPLPGAPRSVRAFSIRAASVAELRIEEPEEVA